MFSQCVNTRTRVTFLSAHSAICKEFCLLMPRTHSPFECTYWQGHILSFWQGFFCTTLQSILVLKNRLPDVFSKLQKHKCFSCLNLLHIISTFLWCKTSLSSVYDLGWALLTTVAAFSCFSVFRLQQLFCESDHGQETSKEDQPGHPRWGGLCCCIFARSAVICNRLSWCCLIFIYIYIYVHIFYFILYPTTYTVIQTSDKQTLPVKRPIPIGPKVSIQPKPMITAVPLAHAQAPIQAKTIIIQPLQTTVLPVVKPAPINIQPAPPTGQLSYHNAYRHRRLCGHMQWYAACHTLPSGADSIYQ